MNNKIYDWTCYLYKLRVEGNCMYVHKDNYGKIVINNSGEPSSERDMWLGQQDGQEVLH